MTEEFIVSRVAAVVFVALAGGIFSVVLSCRISLPMF